MKRADPNILNINLFFEHFPAFNQTYIADMVHLINKNPKVNINITCLLSSDYKTQIKIKIIPSYWIRRISERIRLLIHKKYKLSYIENYWLKHSTDIIHLHHSFLFKHVIGLLKMSSEKRPKIILTLRGSDTYVKPWINPKWNDFYQTYGNQVDAFIVQSKNQKKYLTKWGIEDKRIRVIPSSIRRSMNAKPKTLKSRKIRIVSSFRFIWQKNIDGNLRVIKKLVDLGYDIEYLIYGHGNDIGQIYYLINYHNLEEYVIVKGKVENTDYLKCLNKCDFYLQLSLSESLSISTIEAQSLGIPAIVSKNTGMEETIIDGKTGFAVEYFEIEKASNFIESLIINPKKYFSFSKNAISNVENKFLNHIEVSEHIVLYKSICK